MGKRNKKDKPVQQLKGQLSLEMTYEAWQKELRSELSMVFYPEYVDTHMKSMKWGYISKANYTSIHDCVKKAIATALLDEFRMDGGIIRAYETYHVESLRQAYEDEMCLGPYYEEIDDDGNELPDEEDVIRMPVMTANDTVIAI